MKRTIKLDSSNGIDKLHVVIWETHNPKGIVQIAHGMIEYVERYDEFAQFMNDRGYVVVGNDHLGHGQTAPTVEELGFMTGDKPEEIIVKDMYSVTMEIKKRYEGLPVFLLGHSMGSFLSRMYAMNYSDRINGLILLGSGEESKGTLAMGKFNLALNTLIYGERHKSKLVQNLALGRYNMKFMKEHSARSWISANVENQNQSANDIYCSFMFSNKAYKALLNTVTYIQDPRHIAQISPDLPVLFMSGSDDPVGGFEKGVNLAAEKMRANGVRNVKVRFFEGLRHEIIKEDGKESVFREIFEWIELCK